MGLHLIRKYSFIRGATASELFALKKKKTPMMALDDELIKKLTACSGPMISVAHSVGALAGKFASYPQTKQWLQTTIRQGVMPRSAYRMLINYDPSSPIHGGKICN